MGRPKRWIILETWLNERTESVLTAIILLKLLQCHLIEPNRLAALLAIINMWWLKVKSNKNVTLKSLNRNLNRIRLKNYWVW